MSSLPELPKLPELPELPEGYCYQVAPDEFDFEIVVKSPGFKKYLAFAERHGLVRNVCRELPGTPELLDYIHVIQKSPLWLHLRSLAACTASSLGKYVLSPCAYPTAEQTYQAWRDKLSGKGFEKTVTASGHMRWGVGYEDPALVHFAVDNMLSVCAVGTIHLPLDYMISLIPRYAEGEELRALRALVQSLHLDGTEHLLISPDGIVGRDSGPVDKLPENIVGMLEIKCISPFHHVEDRQGRLSWVDNMETRQWYHPGEIPFVYITQICTQAISGLYRLDMGDDDTMWFIRWSPAGFSEFSIDFGSLILLGIIETLLFFSHCQRVQTEEDLPFRYTDLELPVAQIMGRHYKRILDTMKHRYVCLDGLYPEFYTYQECTRRYRFKAPP